MLMAKGSLYPSPLMIMHSMVPELKLWHEGRRIMCLSTGTGHCNSAKVCCNQAFVGNFCGEPSSWEDQYAVLRYSYIIARVLLSFEDWCDECDCRDEYHASPSGRNFRLFLYHICYHRTRAGSSALYLIWSCWPPARI